MKRDGGKTAALVSVATHGILVASLWGALTLAASPARRPAEITSSFVTPAPLEEPIPEPEPCLAPAETDAPLPEIRDEAPPEERPPFEPPETARPTTLALLPPDRPVLAAARLPLPPRAAPPAPPARAAVAVATPTGPTRLAAPADGNPAPGYPSLAVERGIEGTVLLIVSVSPDGRVTRIEKRESSGSTLLDEAAVRTVETWKFRPALRHGRRVASRVEVPIRFRFD
ncbi:MAG: energy transducer TonB [Planctomycetota bacterium]